MAISSRASAPPALTQILTRIKHNRKQIISESKYNNLNNFKCYNLKRFNFLIRKCSNFKIKKIQ